MGYYLLECPNYENEREKMSKRILDCCWIPNFCFNMLLAAKQEDDFKDWRNMILSQLETYVVETGRFWHTKVTLIVHCAPPKYRELVIK